MSGSGKKQSVVTRPGEKAYRFRALIATLPILICGIRSAPALASNSPGDSTPQEALEAAARKERAKFLDEHDPVYRRLLMMTPTELRAYLPRTLDGLVQPYENKNLAFWIVPSKSRYSRNEAVDIELKIRNLSPESIRIAIPACVGFLRNVAAYIVRAPGYPYLYRNHVVYDVVFDSPSATSVLKAGEARSFVCHLQDEAPARNENKFHLWDYEAFGEGAPSPIPRNRLPPGRYEMRANYDGDESVRALQWDHKKRSQYGPLWTGKALSNKVSFEIAP